MLRKGKGLCSVKGNFFRTKIPVVMVLFVGISNDFSMVKLVSFCHVFFKDDCDYETSFLPQYHLMKLCEGAWKRLVSYHPYSSSYH